MICTSSADSQTHKRIRSSLSISFFSFVSLGHWAICNRLEIVRRLRWTLTLLRPSLVVVIIIWPMKFPVDFITISVYRLEIIEFITENCVYLRLRNRQIDDSGNFTKISSKICACATFPYQLIGEAEEVARKLWEKKCFSVAKDDFTFIRRNEKRQKCQ